MKASKRARPVKRTAAPIDEGTWVRAAVDALKAGGVAALSVEALARKLGVTKGSFYWHFDSREELLRAALERWEQSIGRDLDRLTQIQEPLPRLTRMFQEATEKIEDSLFMAVSGASDNPVVKEFILRISDRQMGFTRQALAELGFPEELARMRSFLAYALYVGILHMARNEPTVLPPLSERLAHVEQAVSLVVRP
jgi:AcrR family transcriptional regulator